MNRNTVTRTLLAVVLVVTLLSTTQQQSLSRRSLIRAVLLEKTPNGCAVGIVFQDVAAAADASDAGEQLKLVTAEGECLETAFYQAELLLTNKADYKLCDYVLLCSQPHIGLMQQYLNLLVSRNTHGRLAAYLYTTDQSLEQIKKASDNESSTLPEWMDTLQANRLNCPRVYRIHSDSVLVPLLYAQENEIPAQSYGAWLVSQSGCTQLFDENSAQMLYLLLQLGKDRSFMLQGREVQLTVQALGIDISSASEIQYTVQARADSALSNDILQVQFRVLSDWLLESCPDELSTLLDWDTVGRMYGVEPIRGASIQFVFNHIPQ